VRVGSAEPSVLLQLEYTGNTHLLYRQAGKGTPHAVVILPTRIWLNGKLQNTMKNDVYWDVTPCGSCKTAFFIVTAVTTSNLT
jgi:hypothetical protein